MSDQPVRPPTRTRVPTTTSEVQRAGEAPTPVPAIEGFEARDGDVLVVAYPEVKLPLRVQFAILNVGGISYSRMLRAGDDVNAEYTKISTWLARQVEGDIKRKAELYINELVAHKRG